MRSAYRVARVELADQVGPEALVEVLAALEAEGLRLRATARATELVAQAMSGTRFVRAGCCFTVRTICPRC